eukprot:4080466-Amphidinium_carterae.1
MAQLSEEQAQRLLQAAETGSAAKTWRMLQEQQGIASTTAHWEEACKLLSLHAGTTVVPQPVDTADLPTFTTWKCVKKFKSKRACDPGGWYHETMQQLWHSPDSFKPIDTWLQNLGLYTPPYSIRRRAM